MKTDQGVEKAIKKQFLIEPTVDWLDRMRTQMSNLGIQRSLNNVAVEILDIYSPSWIEQERQKREKPLVISAYSSESEDDCSVVNKLLVRQTDVD